MTSPSALVSLDEAKDHLNIQSSDPVRDSELQGFIDAATAYIQSFTGPIIGQAFTETYNGGRDTICLFHPPVLSIQSVTEYIGQVAYTLTAVAPGNNAGPYAYSLDNARGGILRRRYTAGYAGPFAAGVGNVIVAYTGGQSAVPADIRMAVLQDIAGLYQPSQLGTNPYGAAGESGNSPLNPIGMFPRVAEILTATSQRTPSIA